MTIYDENVAGQAFTFSSDDNEVTGLATPVFDQSSAYLIDGSETVTQYTPIAVTDDGSVFTENSYFVATSDMPVVITGYDETNGSFAATQTITFGVLSGVDATYKTGFSQISQIIAADGSDSTIVNDNPHGGLLAFTGSGGNALVGYGLLNVFQTSDGGSDAVIFDGASADVQSNALTSGGNDVVSIFGSPIGQQTNTISAVGGGSDQIGLAVGADLTFINNSSSVSAIAMGDDSNLIVAGRGTTLILASGSGGSLTFVANGASQAESIISDFTDGLSINLIGYAGYEVNVVNGSTTLTLSDNSDIIFSGVSDPTAVLSRLSV